MSLVLSLFSGIVPKSVRDPKAEVRGLVDHISRWGSGMPVLSLSMWDHETQFKQCVLASFPCLECYFLRVSTQISGKSNKRISVVETKSC